MEIHNDFNTSVEKALTEIDPNWRDLDGLIVCGTHSPHKDKSEELIERIALARQEGQAFLGICFGHQLAAIEYARNALGISDATSEEWDSKGRYVVKKRDHLKVGLYEGESYWHWYEVEDFILKNWQKPWNFVTMQFHPEYQSSKDHPHPLLVKFLKACGSGNVV
jgi:CTP synthase (UTP-ammonia lyase)